MAVRLDDIDYFLAVAEHGQVRRAAAALGLSQPALTKGLQRLEKELGFPLFERGPRGMTLTPVAEQFRQRTKTLRARYMPRFTGGPPGGAGCAACKSPWGRPPV